MNARLPRKFILALLGLTLLFLTACALPILAARVDGAASTPTAVESAEPAWTPLVAATSTSQPPLTQATRTLVPTVGIPTAVVVTAALPQQSGDPHVVTLRAAQVRHGPGLSYEPSHWLGAGTSAPVRGRSQDGLWWVIPGAGDGPGPVGWIQAADVQLFGSTASVPVIQSPSNPADVPIHSDPGSPPANACVVVPLGSDLGPVLVHLGPGTHFNISHRLGGWAEVVNTEMGWYQVLLGPGEVGWVNGQQVQASGPCS